MCAIPSAGVAQLLPKVYNQFFMNPYIYNPAYAGVEGHTVLFVMHKKQFSGINGAPSLSHANFHVPLKGGIGIGGLAYNESAGLYSQSAGKVSASYLISVDSEHFFRFGMSLGAGTNSFNFGEFDSPSDPAFASLLENETFLIGDFGASYHFGHFNVGFSLPSLFGYELFTGESSTTVRVRPHDYALFKMNYRGHINDNIAIEPHLIYRYNSLLPDQLEATVIFHLLHVVWVGGSYRQDAGFVGLLGAKFMEKIGLGYSYEYGNPNTAGLLGPTHEIHLGYHLGTRKSHAAHSSSFIKSHRKSAELRAKEAELERQRKLQALRESRQSAVSKEKDEDALTLVSGAKTTPEKEEIKTNWNYEKENEPIERINKFGEKERGIKFDRINEKGEKEVVFSWLPPPPPGSKEEKYEIANPNEEPLVRTKPDGTKEAGIKWTRTIDDGEPETLIIWDEIMSEAKANELDHNPAEAHELGDAKIVIRNEEQPVEKNPDPVEEKIVEEKPVEEIPVEVPVKEEPVQKEPKEEGPVVVEEPVKEEPKEEGPVVVEEPVKDEPVQQEEEPVIEEPVVVEKPEVIKEEPVVVSQEEIEKGDPGLTNDFRSTEELSKSDEPQVARRGTHLLELPIGNYVVAGVFEVFENAENFSDQLFQRGFHDIKVGYLSARGQYYVVIYQADTVARAITEMKKIRNRSGLGRVWVLTVNE